MWAYVNSSSNPADCASRGMLPRSLVHHKLWSHGPEWLKSHSDLSLFIIKSSKNSTEIFKESLSYAAMSYNKTFPDFLLKCSSFSRLIRILALCLRLIYSSHQCNRNSRNRGLLTTSEILNATVCVLKLVQEKELSLELNLLRKNKPLPSNSKYLSLNIFLGDQGLIRVGGRLSRYQSLSQDQKYPVLLPKNHLITKLIVEQYHKQHFHTGAQLIFSLIRQRYWIPNGRSFIRQVLNNCLLCKRLKKQA
ncbi:integrase catalytic domain-containing protein [Trichonephila clavipes]|nr:integrase catalytic domain-containing protein [Trichonephila clavipes]